MASTGIGGSGTSKQELVRACGYLGRLNFTAFYSPLLDAKGIRFAGTGSGSGRRGRRISYRARVHLSGNLMVGQTYLSLHDIKPGDRFEIRLVLIEQSGD